MGFARVSQFIHLFYLFFAKLRSVYYICNIIPSPSRYFNIFQQKRFFTDNCGIAANRDLAKYTGSTADLCRFARRCGCASARRRIPRRRATIHGLDDGGSRPLNTVGRGLILINPSATDVQNGRGCGSPVETSAARQKHRPSRQARPAVLPEKVRFRF